MAGFAGNQAELSSIVYEAAANPQLWPMALERIASAFNSRGCLLTTPRFTPGGIPHSPGMHDVLDQFFSENWHAQDLRTNLARSKRCVSGFFSDHDILSSDEMARSEYYRGFARNAGVPWFSAAMLTADVDDDFVAISLQRTDAEGAFKKRELAALNALLPQLRNAAAFAKKLALMRGEAIVQGLEMAAEPSMLLDDKGKVIFVNSGARDMLGSALNITAGRLTAARAGDNANLAGLVDKACVALRPDAATVPELSPVILGMEDGGKTLAVRAAPIRRSGADVLGFSGVLLMFTDLGALKQIDIALAQEIFALTHREVQVLARLGRDASLEALGRHLGISREAVRFHLKSIFLKTNTHRQAELVNLVSRLRSVSGAIHRGV